MKTLLWIALAAVGIWLAWKYVLPMFAPAPVTNNGGSTAGTPPPNPFPKNFDYSTALGRAVALGTQAAKDVLNTNSGNTTGSGAGNPAKGNPLFGQGGGLTNPGKGESV